VHEDGQLVPFGQDGLIRSPEIVAPLELHAALAQDLHRLIVGQPGEGRLDLLQPGQIALEHHKFGLAVLEHPAHHVAEHLLLNPHVLFQVAEGHLGLHHPELHQVAPGLGLLGPEGGAEAVDLPEGHGVGLVVELTALGQVGLVAEVTGLEEGGRALAGTGRQDRTVHAQEALVIQPFGDRAHDLGADAQDRVLARRADPQVAMVHQEVGPVLLGRDGVFLGLLDHLQSADGQLIAAWSARILADLPEQFHGTLLAQPPRGLELLGADAVLQDDRLDGPRAVPQLEELNLPGRTGIAQPASQTHRTSGVLADGFNPGQDGGAGRVQGFHGQCSSKKRGYALGPGPSSLPTSLRRRIQTSQDLAD